MHNLLGSEAGALGIMWRRVFAAQKREVSAIKTWFEVLGFQENPCSILPNGFVTGLLQQERELLTYLKGGHACLLHGEVGTGKTSLLQRTENTLREDGFEVIYIDAKTLSGLSEIDFLTQFYPQGQRRLHLERQARAGSFLARLRLKVAPYKSVVLLLDEFARIPHAALADQIEGYFNQRLIHSFVCAQQRGDVQRTSQSFLDRIQNRHIQTGRLSKEECLAILKQRFGDKGILSEQTMNTLVTECGHLPRRVLESVERVYQHLYDTGELRAALEQQTSITIPDAKMAEFVRQGIVEVPAEPRQEPFTPLKPIPGIALSPLHQQIVLSLYRSPKTIKTLGEELATGEGTINTALCRLRKRNLVVVTRAVRPKLFGLEGDFRARVPMD